MIQEVYNLQDVQRKGDRNIHISRYIIFDFNRGRESIPSPLDQTLPGYTCFKTINLEECSQFKPLSIKK